MVIEISSEHKGAGDVTQGLKLSLSNSIVLMSVRRRKIMHNFLRYAKLLHKSVMKLPSVVTLDLVDLKAPRLSPRDKFTEFKQELRSSSRKVQLRETSAPAREAQHVLKSITGCSRCNGSSEIEHHLLERPKVRQPFATRLRKRRASRFRDTARDTRTAQAMLRQR